MNNMLLDVGASKLMLYANLEEFNKNDYLKLDKARNFLKNIDVNKIPLGKSNIEGDDFYCQTLEYMTEDIEQFQFEVHKKRLDFHYIVDGQEEIDVATGITPNFNDNYNLERDIMYVKKPLHYNKIILNKGDFLLIGMHEPHRTNGMVNGTANKVRKIVLKLGQ